MDILSVIVTGVLCIACFYIGAKTGQTVAKGKDIEMPKVNPMKIYKERQDKREADKELEKIETILQNIDRYDGTSVGQQDIPR